MQPFAPGRSEAPGGSLTSCPDLRSTLPGEGMVDEGIEAVAQKVVRKLVDDLNGSPGSHSRGSCYAANATTPRRWPPRALRGSLTLLGHARFDGIVDRILAPLEPTPVVHGNTFPAHQIGVEPRLARTPPR